MSRKAMLLVAALPAALLVATPVALAGGNGATTFTQTDHNATDSFVDVVPCTGAPATINLTYNDVFHGTISKTGSWFTGTMTGDVVATTLDVNPITYTGHFTTWFGDENNLKKDVEPSTFNVHLTGSDGSTLSAHENAQAATNANGTITVSFDHMVCN
jgi:hypothetical protein